MSTPTRQCRRWEARDLSEQDCGKSGIIFSQYGTRTYTHAPRYKADHHQTRLQMLCRAPVGEDDEDLFFLTDACSKVSIREVARWGYPHPPFCAAYLNTLNISMRTVVIFRYIHWLETVQSFVPVRDADLQGELSVIQMQVCYIFP